MSCHRHALLRQRQLDHAAKLTNHHYDPVVKQTDIAQQREVSKFVEGRGERGGGERESESIESVEEGLHYLHFDTKAGQHIFPKAVAESQRVHGVHFGGRNRLLRKHSEGSGLLV